MSIEFRVYSHFQRLPLCKLLRKTSFLPVQEQNSEGSKQEGSLYLVYDVLVLIFC